ncbi:hypothetical protein GJ496_010835 [Pomphorhynchus laevis]|nr:hypothetical protein GJ496_010835 [Pomphorhynchus laevis]
MHKNLRLLGSLMQVSRRLKRFYFQKLRKQQYIRKFRKRRLHSTTSRASTIFGSGASLEQPTVSISSTSITENNETYSVHKSVASDDNSQCTYAAENLRVQRTNRNLAIAEQLSFINCYKSLVNRNLVRLKNPLQSYVVATDETIKKTPPVKLRRLRSAKCANESDIWTSVQPSIRRRKNTLFNLCDDKAKLDSNAQEPADEEDIITTGLHINQYHEQLLELSKREKESLKIVEELQNQVTSFLPNFEDSLPFQNLKRRHRYIDRFLQDCCKQIDNVLDNPKFAKLRYPNNEIAREVSTGENYSSVGSSGDTVRGQRRDNTRLPIVSDAASPPADMPLSCRTRAAATATSETAKSVEANNFELRRRSSRFQYGAPEWRSMEQLQDYYAKTFQHKDWKDLKDKSSRDDCDPL